MATYRERREARAARLREWADKREARAEAAFGTASGIMDTIPLGQPILVGHHSEGRHRRDLARIDSGMRRGVEHTAKAESMRSRADNIEAAADHAIYSDDPDAIERLEAKLAHLEAERDAIKAYNASCRKGTPDVSLLTESGKRSLASITKHAPYQLRKGGQLPAYASSNLSGTIKTTRDRLAALRAKGEA